MITFTSYIDTKINDRRGRVALLALLDLGDGAGGACLGDAGRGCLPGWSIRFDDGAPLLALAAAAGPFEGRPPALGAAEVRGRTGHGSRLGASADSAVSTTMPRCTTLVGGDVSERPKVQLSKSCVG